MNALKYKAILDDFELYHNDISRHAVDWYPNGRDEIIVILDDGNKVIYNGLRQTIRCIKPSLYNENLSDKEWSKLFGLKLKRIIHDKGLTQTELADLSGMSRVAVNSYIRGKKLPTIYNINKIAKALNYSISELIEVQQWNES